MANLISNKILYHVTVAKPYKQPLSLGQHLRVGNSFNPFFGFYESSLHYPVTLADGTVHQMKALAFLTSVREGTVNCPDLSKHAVEIAQHYLMLARELLMEEVRREEVADAPSRQRCLYMCETVDEARYWSQRIGDTGTICAVECTGTTHRADAGLLLGDSEPLSVTRQRAVQYWRGEASEKPEWETLFVGDGVVTQCGL